MANKKKIKKIVVIGGGTGVSVVLSGLKKYKLELAAIVSMFDSAGSGGMLRSELGILPPGDIRQCLLTLARNMEVAKLCSFRFEKGSLRGHSFGNLLIAAADNDIGNFEEAVERVGKILNIQGKVVPVTLEHSDIKALLNNAIRIENEDDIVNYRDLSKIGLKKLFLEPQVPANKSAIKAINEADLIIIGPGKLYTSLIPNLLVKGMKEAILKSKAKKFFICNLMTQPGNTDGLKVGDIVSIVESYLEKNVFDLIIFNTGRFKGKALERVKAAFPRAIFTEYTRETLKDKRFVGINILNRYIQQINPNDIFVKGANKRTMVVHDSAKLAKAILKLANK